MAKNKSRKPHLDPAASVIKDLGGPTKAARIAGVHISQVYRWMWPESSGGYGGWIPRRPSRRIDDWIKKNGFEVDRSAEAYRPAA